MVAPSILSGISHAFDYVIDYPYGCLEQYASMLLGLAAEETAGRHLGALPGRTDSRAGRIGRAIGRIDACVDEWQVRSWPALDSPEASSYTTAYALYATTRALEEKLPVPRALWETLGESAASDFQQLRERATESPLGEASFIAEAPWIVWSLSEADRLRSADSLRVKADDVEALLSRAGRMPLESHIVLLVAARNATEHNAALGRDWGRLAAPLLDEVRSRRMGRTGRHVWVDPSDPTWGDGIGGDERTTVLFMRLVSVADPRDRDLPAMAAWLADNRKPVTRAWSNNHVSALALDQLALVAATIEGVPRPVAGRVSAGDLVIPFAFGERRDETLRREIPLPEIARRAGAAGQVPFVAESPEGTVYVEASLDRARPAGSAPAREEGLIVSREYVDVEGRPLGETVPLGEPLFVHLAVVVSRPTRALMVEDPLPAGMEALDLEFRNAPHVAMDRDEADIGVRSRRSGSGEPPDAAKLPIAYRELRDRSARLFAEDVEAGVYHVYYPAVAVAAGSYEVPGARAEFMYSPEIYATSAAEAIRIVRED